MAQKRNFSTRKTRPKPVSLSPADIAVINQLEDKAYRSATLLPPTFTDLVRAALRALNECSTKDFERHLDTLEYQKPGRPRKSARL